MTACDRRKPAITGGTMEHRARFRIFSVTMAAVFAISSATAPCSAEPNAPAGYRELVALFEEWRAFERTARRDGAPDYTAATMARGRSDWKAPRAPGSSVHARAGHAGTSWENLQVLFVVLAGPEPQWVPRGVPAAKKLKRSVHTGFCVRDIVAANSGS